MYGVSEYYEQLAEEVIIARPELHFIREEGIRVGFVVSDAAARSNNSYIFGKCKKVGALEKVYAKKDFIIIIYEPNVAHMSESQKKILLWHEMLHIGSDHEEEPKLFIVNHDVEDFKRIIDKYGTDWAEVHQELEDVK